MPDRIPLKDNPEFKSIKNAVIQETMNIFADRTPIEDKMAEPPPDTNEPKLSADDDRSENEPIEQDDRYFASSYGGGKQKKKTWWTTSVKRFISFFTAQKRRRPISRKPFPSYRDRSKQRQRLCYA